MTPETFCEQFATFAEAPHGVAKLRELILQLAVQGKLGTHDENDEPASEVLRQIDDEKSRLAKFGKLKSPSLLPPVDEREIPHGWAVVRLGSFIELISGQHLTPEEYNEAGEGYPYLTGPADFGERHPVATRWTHADRALARRDDILITVKGAGIGKSNIVATETTFISRQLMAVRPIIVDRDFVHLVLRSGYDQFQRQGVGIAIPGIGRDDILHFIVALPPLAEQRRIVGKVDQLLGLCDELAARQAARREARERLVGATLDRLVSDSWERLPACLPAADQSRGIRHNTRQPPPNTPTHTGQRALSESADTRQAGSLSHAHRLRDHFDRLFDTPTTLPQLRQAILQLAVQGQLVPQDPNDEPAILLAKDQKKSVVEIAEKELPFELPDSWRWCRLGSIAEFINGDRGKNYPNKNEYVPMGLPFINTGHIEPDGSLDLRSMHYITREKFDSLRGGKIEPDDLVYCLRGATLGKTAFVEPFYEGAIASSLVIIRLDRSVDRRFIYYFLLSPLGRQLIKRFDNGSAQPNLSSNSVTRYVTPVPPLSEQKRIVSKVTELLSLCDALEAKLTQAESASTQLLSAAVHHLLTQCS